jgi:hypothetical protein
LVLSSDYKNGANDGTDVGQSGFLSRKYIGRSGEDEIRSRKNEMPNGCSPLPGGYSPSQDKTWELMAIMQAVQEKIEAVCRGPSRKGEG